MTRRRETSPTPIHPLWFLFVMVVVLASAFVLWDPLDVLIVAGFGITFGSLCLMLLLFNKHLVYLPAVLLGYSLVFHYELLWDSIMPWGAVGGAACLLLFLLWVLLTTQGRIWWHDWRGSLAMQSGSYQDAEKRFRRSLELRELKYGSDHPRVAASYTMLANLAQERGETDQVRRFAQDALALQERHLPPDHPNTRITLNLLGGALVTEGKFADAESIYRKLVEHTPRKAGMARLERAVFLHNLALCIMEQGGYAQAEDLCRDAEQLQQQEPYLRLWGCKAYVRSLMAEILLRQEKPQEAWRVAADAVSLIEPQIAPYQVFRTIPMLRLARVALRLERPSEALGIAQEVIAAQEAFFGAEHYFLTGGLLVQGQAFAQMDRYAEAEDSFRRALALCERTLPYHPRNAEIMDECGWMLLRQGRIDAAEPLLKRAMEKRRAVLPNHHPDLAVSLAHNAALQRERGLEKEAKHLAAESALVRERHYARQNLSPVQS